MPAPRTEYPWRFEVCKDCTRENVAGFRVTDSMWARVVGYETVLCIWCFDQRAASTDIDWTEEPIEFYCVSTVGNRKWQMVREIQPGEVAQR